VPVAWVGRACSTIILVCPVRVVGGRRVAMRKETCTYVQVVVIMFVKFALILSWEVFVLMMHAQAPVRHSSSSSTTRRHRRKRHRRTSRSSLPCCQRRTLATTRDTGGVEAVALV
jgi:hypothetical protein